MAAAAQSLQALVANLFKDDGVEGDFITGNRMADIIFLPLVAGGLFQVARLALLWLVIEPLGQRVLAAKLKKSDARMLPSKRVAWFTKWNESFWKMIAYTFLTCVALGVSYNERWFRDPRYFWVGATRLPLNFFVERKLLVAYIIEQGFYLQAIPFLFFTEVRRKDWFESFLHHVVTVVLVYYSYWANFMRPGIIIMQLHDCSDVFLELAKLLRYGGKTDAGTGAFVVFLLSWVYLRLVIYPRMVLSSFLRDPIELVANPHGVETQPHYMLFSCLFMILLFLHIYWTYLIIMVLVRMFTVGQAADVREDDDDDD